MRPSVAKLSLISALVFRLLISSVPALHAEETWESLQVGTNILKNVTVLQATPIDLILKHESGYLRIKLSDLPAPLKTKYPYDVRKAETYLKQKTALQRWDAILARERDLRRQISDLELQQERVRATMRVIRGRRGKPDQGHMQNLQREVDNFEKDKQVLQSELGRLEQIRVAMQGQYYGPTPVVARVNVAGRWNWSVGGGKYRGKMELLQTPDGNLSGRFHDTSSSSKGTIAGTVIGNVVQFTRKWATHEQFYNLTLNAEGTCLTGTLSGKRDTAAGHDFTANRE